MIADVALVGHAERRCGWSGLRTEYEGESAVMTAHRDKPWLNPDLCRPFDGGGIQRAVPRQSGAGPDRPFGRLRSADPDRLRQRPRAGRGRGRQGRRADLPSRRYGDPVRRHPADRMNTSMTINATAPWLLGALYRRRPNEQGAAAPALSGHDAERHHQGISLPAGPTFSRRALRCG